MNKSTNSQNALKVFNFFPSFENIPAMALDVHLYVFGREGRLIESLAVNRDKTTLSMSEEELQNAKLILAPAPDANSEAAITFGDVCTRHAFLAQVSLDAAQSNYVLPPVPEEIWRWWLVHSLWKKVH